jgi:hypothetical protein
MFDNKFLITLLGLVVAVVAINNIKSKDDDEEIKEGFGMLPSMQYKVDVQAAPSQKAAQKGDFFSVPGTYQAMLNPRFSNVDYGANIRYNMPSYDNRGAPCNPLGYASNPLTYASMVNMQGNKENYVRPTLNGNSTVRENYGSTSCGANCVTDCRKGGLPPSFHGGAPVMDADYADGNYNDIRDQSYKKSSIPATTSMLPVRDMTAMNAAGDDVQPIVYDRYIYANRNSRLRSQGDPIRGDLAITPCNTGWFQVSVQPNIDLQQGALNVLGGINNEQAKSMADIIFKTSGNAQTAIAGVDMANHVNMNTTFGGGLSAGVSDINVTAFP